MTCTKKLQMQVVILGGSRLSFCFLDGGMIITEIEMPIQYRDRQVGD